MPRRETDDEMMRNRNKAVLEEFVAFCRAHSEYGFWQALAYWSDAAFLLHIPRGFSPKVASWEDNMDKVRDTYFWEGRNG
jgi:hypothetical protein